MRVTAIFLIIGLLCTTTSGFAAGLEQPEVKFKETIDIGVSTNEIAITSDFSGADLTVFGALDNIDSFLQAVGQYDIVVTLEGPKTEAILRKKERVAGIWINRQSMTFDAVPESYSLASTRVLDTITSPLELGNVSIGISDIRLAPNNYIGNLNDLADFRAAFRRLKLGNGLFQNNEGGVRFVSPTLFRATLRLPANVPNGVHTVHAYLFKSGQFVMEKKLPLRVTKTGFEQAITDAAHERPFFYGVFSVILAIITGWGASLIFRRD
jgi:uncharacterized protein (TIGR02186 family)